MTAHKIFDGAFVMYSDMHLKDGDKLRLRYTLAYGKDIGGYTEGDENYDICF